MRHFFILFAFAICATACAKSTNKPTMTAANENPTTETPSTETPPENPTTNKTPQTNKPLNVPSDPPYIVLSANLDEPNGYGFCLDTYGRGQSDLMHTHTCKPSNPDEPQESASNETRFVYNVETQQVMSYAYTGFCMQALIAGDETVFSLLKCSEHARQKFVHNAEDGSCLLYTSPSPRD